MSQLTKEEIANLFYAADIDHNGQLSYDEISNIMTIINNGIKPSDSTIQQCLNTMDTNNDGLINEEEFLNTILKWLEQINSHDNLTSNSTSSSSIRKRSHSGDGGGYNSPSGPNSPTNKKKIITNITNFFKQFAPINNYEDEQKRILTNNSNYQTNMSLHTIHREYPKYNPNEKILLYEEIKVILHEGRDILIQEINSFNWEMIVTGINKIQKLLSIVELFSTSEERFDFSSTIFQIFDGLTQTDSNSNCIIRRICTLLNPEVPSAIQAHVYIPCLKALRNYITGPGVTPINPSLPIEDSIWNPINGFTKQIVELDNLPLRLLKIYDMCITSLQLTSEIQQILCECLKCMIVYVEDHSGCLEGMLQNGLRNKIILLLQTEYFLTNEIIKYSLHLLCILCGYTHSFDTDDQQDEKTTPLSSSTMRSGATATTAVVISSIPIIIGVNEQMLYEILLIINNLLTRSTSITQTNTGLSSINVLIDEIIVINIAILCQYLLPLCRSTDPMYQSILNQLLVLYQHNWNIETSVCQAIYITLNHTFHEIIRVSSETCQFLFSNTNIHVVLFQQLQYISSIDSYQATLSSSTPITANSANSAPTTASSTSSASVSSLTSTSTSSDLSMTLLHDLFSSCLSIYELLLTSHHYSILLDKRNYNFIKLCVILLSSQDYNFYLVEFLTHCLLVEELCVEYLSLGILDGLFNLFLKFKQNSNMLSRILRVYIGPTYSITLLNQIITLLYQLLTRNILHYVTIFNSNHLECIGQLHLMICNELKRGLLRYSSELQELTDHLWIFLNEIINGYTLINSPLSEYVKNEYIPLIQRWNEELERSYKEGLMLIKTSIDMDIASTGEEDNQDYSNVHSLLRNGIVSSNDLLITAIPLWDRKGGHGNQRAHVTVPLDITMDSLRNGFSSLYQMDLILYYENDEKKRVPLLQRRDFDQLIERTMTSSSSSLVTKQTNKIPIILYLNQNTSSSFSASSSSSTSSPLSYHSSGLINSHKSQVMHELKQTCDLLNKKIDMKIMEIFYDYFALHCSHSGEINKDQFISLLLSLNQGFNEIEGEYIFNAFDDDGNGMLTLNEICIGLSKLLSGTLDDKLQIIFYSYDHDRNNKLDLEELTNMIMVSTNKSFEESRGLALTAGNQFDRNGDGVLDIHEFKEAYYSGYIPLGINWTTANQQRNQRFNQSNHYYPGNNNNQHNKQPYPGTNNSKPNGKGFLNRYNNNNNNNNSQPQQQQQGAPFNSFKNQFGANNKFKPFSGGRGGVGAGVGAGEGGGGGRGGGGGGGKGGGRSFDDLFQKSHQNTPRYNTTAGSTPSTPRGNKSHNRNNNQEIRRAFSVGADAFDDYEATPDQIPSLTRQGGGGGDGGGNNNALPPSVPKLTRVPGGRTQDDSVLDQHKKNNRR